MAYADAIRNGTANFNTTATLIEGTCPDGAFANYTSVQNTASSTLADVTGASVTVTVATGDSVTIIADYSFSGGTVGDYLNMTIREDSTDIGRTTSDYIAVSATDGNRQSGFLHFTRISPTAGSRTYKLRYARFGSGTVYLKNINLTAIVFQNR